MRNDEWKSGIKLIHLVDSATEQTREMYKEIQICHLLADQHSGECTSKEIECDEVGSHVDDIKVWEGMCDQSVPPSSL